MLHRAYKLSPLCMIVMSALASYSTYAANVVEFNTDLLDINDKQNINLEQFSRAGYIMPGTYAFKIQVNTDALPEQRVTFIPTADSEAGSVPCITPNITNQLGLKEEMFAQLKWLNDGECLDLSSLPGVTARGDLSALALYLNVPQAYLEYRTATWDPPSLWDNGIPGVFLDYNMNGRANHSQKNSTNIYTVTGNGVAGANMGAWRMRADWQARFNHSTNSSNSNNHELKWTRYYVYRAIVKLRASLTLGDDYLSSDLFDSFRFTGGSLRSDVKMLPPNLRGYAPEVTGVAATNATVIISQQGRVIYQTQVAAGPFRIQNLDDTVNGKLNVRVEEQNGTVQNFDVDTASIPYLTRPGSVRYKVAVGRPTSIDHRSQGDVFAAGEASWGVSNGWSLFGGSLNSQNYNSFAIGVGRDLLAFGAISFDITHALANLNSHMDSTNKGNISGSSYRINYSKRFDEYDSAVQFAGYRFSERNYMSMSDYLEYRNSGRQYYGGKEMYVISFNKAFRDLGISVNLNYNHQTYWDRPNNDRYNLMVTKTADIGNFKNINMSLSAYRNIYQGTTDDGMYLSLSMPWGNSANIGYSLAANRDNVTNNVTYYDRINSTTSYQIGGGSTSQGAAGNAFITHNGTNARVIANANFLSNGYNAFGIGAQGGITLTPNGGGLHRVSNMGGTRLLVDTDGISNVPVKGTGAPVYTNIFGKAVIPDVNSYYRNKTKIDVNQLPPDVEATDSVVQTTLTEGAIGYRKFDVVAGRKQMVSIRFENGEYPPFGAMIRNSKGKNTGVMDDNGQAYISGIKPNEVMTISWSSTESCEIHFPAVLDDVSNNFLMPCKIATMK
ncbi:outer membrane usher protein [uncultured Cedecea sp.]|uniref:outer membrane usher protein n=1 Tax=uncultured Cedecea sp. TaxID=988762 RepID=UPI002630EEA9|nr:outer membrane usher protein [uncultured Cedecea sp.]